MKTYLTKVIHFWPKFLFLTKISIFDQKFHFWPKFPLLTKISTFDQNFWRKFQFLTILYFWPSIMINETPGPGDQDKKRIEKFCFQEQNKIKNFNKKLWDNRGSGNFLLRTSEILPSKWINEICSLNIYMHQLGKCIHTILPLHAPPGCTQAIDGFCLSWCKNGYYIFVLYKNQKQFKRIFCVNQNNKSLK